MSDVDYISVFIKELDGSNGKWNKLDDLEGKIRIYENTLTDNVDGSKYIEEIKGTILSEVKANIRKAKELINDAVNEINHL